MRSRRTLGLSVLVVAIAAGGAAAALAAGTFTDDDGNTHEGDIEAIAAEGITKGCNPPANDLYCPDDFVTRGQMAAFLVRAMGYTDDGGGDLFVDDAGSIFEADIDKLATAGVTKGCNPPTNDQYCPDDFVTRGQMASFLARALELDPITPPSTPPSTSTRSSSTTSTTAGRNCDPAYPDFCIPSPPPALACVDIDKSNFTVLPPDPHNFDSDNNGVGCESDR